MTPCASWRHWDVPWNSRPGPQAADDWRSLAHRDAHSFRGFIASGREHVLTRSFHVLHSISRSEGCLHASFTTALPSAPLGRGADGTPKRWQQYPADSFQSDAN